MANCVLCGREGAVQVLKEQTGGVPLCKYCEQDTKYLFDAAQQEMPGIFINYRKAYGSVFKSDEATRIIGMANEVRQKWLVGFSQDPGRPSPPIPERYVPCWETHPVDAAEKPAREKSPQPKAFMPQ